MTGGNGDRPPVQTAPAEFTINVTGQSGDGPVRDVGTVKLEVELPVTVDTEGGVLRIETDDDTWRLAVAQGLRLLAAQLEEGAA